MQEIGEARGTRLYASEDAYLSYFNSPYIGHSHAAAIDIYPAHQEWGGPVISPVTGKLIRIQKTSMGMKKEFPTDDFDFGIAIQPEKCKDTIVRILHCNPTLKEGDVVEYGDEIGFTIRSRYFNYWTGPHYHIEIMYIDAFLRSTRSFPLQLPFNFKTQTAKELPTTVEFHVEEVTKDYITGYPRGFSHTEVGNYIGISGIKNETDIVGILDGGISHYKHGGVIGYRNGVQGTTIGLQKLSVGTITHSMPGAGFFLRGPSINCFLDSTKLRGLSCFMYPKNFVKQQVSRLLLVPKYYNEFIGQISKGDVCELKIRSANNTIKAE